MATFTDRSLPGVWNALRFSYGVGFIIAGADKFFNFLTNWEKYLSPAIPQALNVDASAILMVAGAIEVILGVLLVSGVARTGGYLAGTWLLAASANLVLVGGYFDIALGGLLMAAGAYSVAGLTAPSTFEVRRGSRYQPYGT